MTPPPTEDTSSPESLRRQFDALQTRHKNLDSAVHAWKVAIKAGAFVLATILGFFGLNHFNGWVPMLQLRGEKGDPGVGAPIGAIVAWQSDTLPSESGEWRVCDGRPVAFSEALWRALGGLYGNPPFKNGPRPPGIQLPNFQGMFLRGAGESQGTPEAKSKVKSGALGELQLDQASLNTGGEQNFQHLIPGSGGVAIFKLREIRTKLGENGAETLDKHGNANGVYFPSLSRGHEEGARKWYMESRPRNFAVHWIIRVK